MTALDMTALCLVTYLILGAIACVAMIAWGCRHNNGGRL